MLRAWRLGRHRLRHAMGREHHRRPGIGDFVQFLDEDRALGLAGRRRRICCGRSRGAHRPARRISRAPVRRSGWRGRRRRRSRAARRAICQVAALFAIGSEMRVRRAPSQVAAATVPRREAHCRSPARRHSGPGTSARVIRCPWRGKCSRSLRPRARRTFRRRPEAPARRQGALARARSTPPACRPSRPSPFPAPPGTRCRPSDDGGGTRLRTHWVAMLFRLVGRDGRAAAAGGPHLGAAHMPRA